MMRRITDHIIESDTTRQIEIYAVDEQDASRANFQYEILYPINSGAASLKDTKISFQNGSVSDDGVNGLTEEVLLAIVIDRLRSFYGINVAIALTHCEDALMRLQKNTRDRIKHGVEGLIKT